MLDLASATPRAWVDEAWASIDTLLLDHAHCEKKAASTAIGFLFRYPMDAALQAPLSAHAREELEHFELLLGVLEKRGKAFGPLSQSPYAGRLHEHLNKVEPARFLDSLLACAVIEARSCERMKLLADHLPDAELRELYRSLLATEARHFHTYVDLAAQRYGLAETRGRLHVIAEWEAAVLREPSELRMHSGFA